MKAKGAEIWAFWQAWPPGDDGYIDDYEQNIADGDPEKGEEKCLLDLTESYDLDLFGCIWWQGKDKNGREADPPKAAPWKGEEVVGFDAYFRFWKRQQADAPTLVFVPKGDLEAFKQICKEHRWKISR